MTRHRFVAALIGVAILAGCQQSQPPQPAPAATPAPTPPPAPTPTPGPGGGGGATAADKGDLVAHNLIVMTENTGHADPNLGTTTCIATVTTYNLKVMRNQKISWHVINDPYHPCPDLDPTQIEIKFMQAVLTNEMMPNGPPKDVAPGGKNGIEARVRHKDTMYEFKMKKKYVIRYQGAQASPDPDIEINGDCSDCGN